MKRTLRSVVFFESLSEPQIQQLVDMAESRSVEKGGVLFSEGRVENHLYLLEEGRVEISRDGPHFGRQTFALLGPGEHFGALSLFYSEAHFATATAVEATRVWVIRHEDFQARLRKKPGARPCDSQGNVVRGSRRARRDSKIDDSVRPPVEASDRAARQVTHHPPVRRPSGPATPAG